MSALETLPCGCEFDSETGEVFWNGLGPGGCVEHEPENAFELAVLPPEKLGRPV